MITRSAPLKRSAIKPKYRKKKPGDNSEYLDFIRTLPCLVCHKEMYQFFRPELWALLEIIDTARTLRQKTKTDAAHIGLSTSRRGPSQKFPDNESLPLCHHDHHQNGTESVHRMGPDRFFPHHGLDRDESVGMFQEIYRLRENQ